MFLGMLLVDAALAAWAVGILGQPNAPRWVRIVLVWIILTMIVSVVLVLAASRGIAVGVTEKGAALIGPIGSIVAATALLYATAQQRKAKRKP